MASTNGNGQVKVPKARPGGITGKGFGAPDGPDPVAAGKKGAAAKEAAIQANIELAREYAAAHLVEAVEVFVSALEAEWEKDADSSPQWFVRLKAAKELVDRVMGQASQKIEHSNTEDEFSKRVADLVAEMESLERAEHASP